MPPSISRWLFTCCAMVFIMALIGAITRLTESGLSITEWAPIKGALPPLTADAWAKAFAAYQAIPQYQILNQGMTLDEFKNIYFWEWLHRLWGRLIGLVFALPYFYFLLRGQLDKKRAIRLAAIFMLGGLQGFIGWFMVQSGLEPNSGTFVSPYRLALHLGFALLVYSLLLWEGLDNNKPQKSATQHSILGWSVFGLLCLTIIWGAFVAGHRAGYVYNTWPLMEDQFLPVEAWTLTPAWLNAFANTALVQFIHRWLAPITGFLILFWVWQKLQQTQKTNNRANNRQWLYALALMVFVQIGLGISTLLTHVNPVLATAHQAGAIILLTLMLVNLRKN